MEKQQSMSSSATSYSYFLENFEKRSKEKDDTYSANFVIDAYLGGVEDGKRSRLNELKSTFKKNTEIALKQLDFFEDVLKGSHNIVTEHLYLRIIAYDLFEVIYISKGKISFDESLKIATSKKRFNSFLNDLSNIRINISVFGNDSNLNLKKFKDDGFYKLR